MYHGEIENLSDSSNTASHVSGVSQARSEAAQIPALSPCAPCLLTPPTSLSCALPTCSQPWTGGPSFSSPAPEQRFAASWQRALSSDRPANDQAAYELELSFLWISVC